MHAVLRPTDACHEQSVLRHMKGALELSAGCNWCMVVVVQSWWEGGEEEKGLRVVIETSQGRASSLALCVDLAQLPPALAVHQPQLARVVLDKRGALRGRGVGQGGRW